MISKAGEILEVGEQAYANCRPPLQEQEDGGYQMTDIVQINSFLWHFRKQKLWGVLI
jgi:hypothetical protein